MLVWIVTIYEPLPLGASGVRAMRNGLMVKAFHEAGNEIELWTSSFDHIEKINHSDISKLEKVSDTVSIQYIFGCGYDKDVSWSRIKHNRQSAREFKKIAFSRKKMPDLIISQIPTLELAEATIDFAKINDIPILMDIRDLWPDNYKRLFPNYLRFLYYAAFVFEIFRIRKILRNATGIIAVSESYLQWALSIAGRLPTKCDRVFHIGYQHKRKESNAIAREVDLFKQKYNVDKNSFNVLFAGTFCSSYELDTVISAAKNLISSSNNIKFIIAGKGDGEQKIENEADSLPNVQYVGWLNDLELRALLSISNIGLAPYSKGALMSLPNKPFEYMASGIPIVSSLNGELHCMIEEYDIGINYPAGDSKALSKAIYDLFSDQLETQSKGERAKELFNRKFQSDTLYKELEIFANSVVEMESRKYT